MKALVLFTVAWCAVSFGCSDSENLTLPDLTGAWREVEPEGIIQLEGSSITTLELNDDFTFTMTLRKWTDAVRYDDPCRGVDEYYIKGTYTNTSSEISLSGCYTDFLFKDCMAVCDGSLDFSKTYSYVLKKDQLILDPAAHPMVGHSMERM